MTVDLAESGGRVTPRITCQYREWVDDAGDEFSGRYAEPNCQEFATHISCVPYAGTLTCPDHKCRCALKLDDDLKTEGERRRELAQLERELIDLACIRWGGKECDNPGDDTWMKAIQPIFEARRALERFRSK